MCQIKPKLEYYNNKNDNPPTKVIIGGNTEPYPILTKSTERLQVDIDCEATDNSAAVTIWIKSETDKILYFDSVAMYKDKHADDIPEEEWIYRYRNNYQLYGDVSKCGNPATLEINAPIYDIKCAVNIRRYENKDMNEAGIDFQSAKDVTWDMIVDPNNTNNMIPGNLSLSYCGNINGPYCATKHFFKIVLEPNQRLDVEPLFTVKPPGYSTSVTMEVFDKNFKLLDTIYTDFVESVVKVRKEFSSSSPEPETFYIVLCNQGNRHLYYVLFFKRN